jgi:Bacterial Ig domain
MVSGLTEGPYYWLVKSFGADGKESAESEKNRFTIIAKEVDSGKIALQLDPFIQHGRVIELTGKTEAGARVMVNGHEVPVVGADGSFHFFTPPLPNGETMITVTAQDAKGGVNTEQQKVVIQ